MVKDRTLHNLVKRGLMAMSATKRDEKKAHIYASYQDRQAFFSKYEKGNEVLCKRYGINMIPVIMTMEDGDSSARFMQTKYATFAPSISRYLRQWIMQPKRFIVFYTRKIVSYLMGAFPSLDRLFMPIRRLRNLLIHKFF